MNKQTQIRLMHRVFEHLKAGTTDLSPDIERNSVASYASPQWLAREEATLFRHYPLAMGFSCQLPKPGDYMTNDLSGMPIVIVRREDGGIGAFLNACAHRGARVVEGQGNRRNLVCPYHGWAYRLDGSLRGVPDERSFPGVDKCTHGLRPVPVAEHGGMIWVVPSPDADPKLDIAAFLGPELDAEIQAFGLPNYHHFETRLITRKMNWKLALDTFLEPYHLAVLHRNTVAPLFQANVCLFDAFGPHLREVLPRRSLDGQKGLPEEQWDCIAHNTLVYVLFPNTVFVVQVDHIETWRVFPVKGKVDECVMYLDFYSPNPIDTDSARGYWGRNMDLTIRTVCEEDFPACEGMQVGFNALARTEVIYGRNEPALAHYERCIREAVASGAV